MRLRIRKVGFWYALWGERRRILVSWQLQLSFAAAVAAGALLKNGQIRDSLSSVTTAELGIAATLFGVVLAGLAVLVIFLNEDYLRLFLSRPDPAARFDRIIFPFWLTSVLAVVSILWDVATLLTTQIVDTLGRRILMAGSTWFFLWMLFETLSIVGLISGHGANRARQILARIAAEQRSGPSGASAVDEVESSPHPD